MPHFSTVCGSWFKPRRETKADNFDLFPSVTRSHETFINTSSMAVPRVHANLHLDLPESWQCPGIDLSISTTCLSSTCPITSPPKIRVESTFWGALDPVFWSLLNPHADSTSVTSLSTSAVHGRPNLKTLASGNWGNTHQLRTMIYEFLWDEKEKNKRFIHQSVFVTLSQLAVGWIGLSKQVEKGTMETSSSSQRDIGVKQSKQKGSKN